MAIEIWDGQLRVHQHILYSISIHFRVHFPFVHSHCASVGCACCRSDMDVGLDGTSLRIIILIILVDDGVVSVVIVVVVVVVDNG